MSILIAYKKGDTVYMGTDTRVIVNEHKKNDLCTSNYKIQRLKGRLIVGITADRLTRQTIFAYPEIFAFDKKEELLSDYLIKDKDSSLVKIVRNKTHSALPVKTHYTVLKTGQETSLLRVNLLTGRTHQIRAHLAFYGHFIIGDGKYGVEEINRRLKVKKQQLSSISLTLHFSDNSPLKYLDNKTFTVDKKINVY